jgi:hypothetical protein
LYLIQSGSFDRYQMASEHRKRNADHGISQTKSRSWSSDGRLLLFAMTDEKLAAIFWARLFVATGRGSLSPIGIGESSEANGHR